MKLSFFHPRHALGRIAIGLACGAALGLLLSLRFSPAIAALGGWDGAGLAVLLLAWIHIASADAARTQEQAGADDPGRTTVYALVLLTSTFSLLAATVLVRSAKGIAAAQARELVALCLTTVAASWALTHTAFALRYAHLYYREDDEGIGGVEFPGGARPTYFDFAYLAFTVGMCFQVSDTSITSPQIRRAILLQALLSFVYNTAILAFVLNLVFGLAN